MNDNKLPKIIYAWETSKNSSGNLGEWVEPAERSHEILNAGYHPFINAEEFPKLLHMIQANERIGSWLSAALEDPKVCDEMKADINAWFEVNK